MGNRYRHDEKIIIAIRNKESTGAINYWIFMIELAVCLIFILQDFFVGIVMFLICCGISFFINKSSNKYNLANVKNIHEDIFIINVKLEKKFLIWATFSSEQFCFSVVWDRHICKDTAYMNGEIGDPYCAVFVKHFEKPIAIFEGHYDGQNYKVVKPKIL